MWLLIMSKIPNKGWNSTLLESARQRAGVQAVLSEIGQVLAACICFAFQTQWSPQGCTSPLHSMLEPYLGWQLQSARLVPACDFNRCTLEPPKLMQNPSRQSPNSKSMY